MKLTTLLPALLVPASALARPSWFEGPDQVSILDDSLKVDGDNPLYFCANTKDDILTDLSVDLNPNPPHA